MTIEQAVMQQLQTLPVEKKQEVLDFVEFLKTKVTAKEKLRNPIGLFANLRIEISDQDLADVRQEMFTLGTIGHQSKK